MLTPSRSCGQRRPLVLVSVRDPQAGFWRRWMASGWIWKANCQAISYRNRVYGNRKARTCQSPRPWSSGSGLGLGVESHSQLGTRGCGRCSDRSRGGDQRCMAFGVSCTVPLTPSGIGYSSCLRRKLRIACRRKESRPGGRRPTRGLAAAMSVARWLARTAGAGAGALPASGHHVELLPGRGMAVQVAPTNLQPPPEQLPCR